MAQPSKSKVITIKGNEYQVSFPNNRQIIAIYARKMQLSKEMYDSLSFSIDGNSKYIALQIDMTATFENILPPQFFKDLNVESIVDLDALQTAELVKVYQEQYVSWFTEWTTAIAEILNSKKEEEKKDAA